MNAANAASGAGHDAQTVDVLVFVPRDPDDKRPFSWSKHLTVGEAAAGAAPSFGITGGQPTLARDGKPLDRTKQLVAEHVREGEVLELIGGGGGV
jgi:hypothetical protein